MHYLKQFWIVLLPIFFFLLIGSILIWKYKKWVIKKVAQDPEALARLMFSIGSKFGLKTAPYKSFWKSIIGEKLIDFGVLEKRSYAFKYYIEYSAYISQKNDEKHITVRVVENFQDPGFTEITLGAPSVRWIIFQPDTCKQIKSILGLNEKEFMNKFRASTVTSYELHDIPGKWVRIRESFYKMLGITNLRFITTLDKMTRNIPDRGRTKTIWSQQIQLFFAEEYGEPLLIIKAYMRLVGARKLFGKIPSGLIQEMRMYPFGEKGRNGLRLAITKFLS